MTQRLTLYFEHCPSHTGPANTEPVTTEPVTTEPAITAPATNDSDTNGPAANVPATEAVSFALYEGEQLLATGTEPLDAIVKRCNTNSGIDVTVIVPGELVSTLVITVPDGSRKHLQQALPYLLENELAAPVETLHIAAAGKPDQDGKLLCGVIDKSLLEQYLALLEQAGINPTRLIPDYWALPKSDSPQVVKHGQRLLVRLPSDEGVVMPETTTPQCLAMLLPELSLQALPETESEPFAWIMPELVAEIPANLLQGEYSPVSINNYACLAKPALIAASLCLMVYIGYFLAAGWYFNHRAEALLAASETRYRELFPSDQRIINLRSQMQTHLNRAGTDPDGPVFFELIGAFATAKQAQTDPASVRNIRFERINKALQLELQTGSLNYASNLQKAIQSQGVSTDVLSANTNDEGVIARLRLSTGAPR